MTTIGDAVPQKRLKIKFSSKRIEAEPRDRPNRSGPKSSILDGQGYNTSVCGNENENKLHRCVVHLSDEKDLIVDNAKIKPSQAGAKKRAPPGGMEDHKDKRQRLDRTVKQQCSFILKKLMTHPAGWVFSKPVDPVALNIPDYLSIISSPMDLGTIKSKLDKDVYFCAEDFAADVRLTFSNAMLYNPPSNHVHAIAKELNDIFDTRWKSVVAKVNCESLNLQQGKIFGGRTHDICQLWQNCHKTAASCDSSLLKKPMSFDEKQMLKKELMEVLKGKMPPHLHSFLQKLGLVLQNHERIKVLVDTCDDKMLWKLKRVTRSCFSARVTEVRGSTTALKCGPKTPVKNIHKGLDKLPLSLVACKCGSRGTGIGTGPCHCNRRCDSSQESSSDLSSDKSISNDDATKMAKNSAVSHIRQFDQDSDGAASALDEENTCPSSKFTTLATVSASVEGGDTPAFDVPLSPKKALRAAMLKRRFADTILKAQQRTLLDHCDKADPAKLQQEKERLERKQREEKARIEAQIKAAEAASLLKAETQMKIQREREREAARIALQKMERTVDIDDNLKILKDLEILSGCPVAHYPSEAHLMSPLERLGLFMKDDYLGDDEEEDAVLNEAGEEGEIL